MKGKKHLAGSPIEPKLADEIRPKRGPGSFKERAIAAASADGVVVENVFDVGENAPVQVDLPVQPVAPKSVQNGRMRINFNEARFFITKDERLLDLDIAFALTPDHVGILPREIEHAWEFVKAGGSKKALDVPCPHAVRARFYLLPSKSEKPVLTIQDAELAKVVLAEVVEKGRGKTIKYIRLAFALRVNRGDHVNEFACESDGSEFWLELFEPQSRL